MSYQERNLYQAFMIKNILKLNDADSFFVLGDVFASLEKSLNRCPTPFEIVKEFENRG